MKPLMLICLLIGFAIATPVPEPEVKALEVAKPEEPKVQAKNGQEEQDASSAAIKIPVDNANKLLYDLDAQVKQLFVDSSIPIKEEKSDDSGVSGEPEAVHSYSAANRELSDIVPRQSPPNQPASLVTQLENLEKRLLSTINELQTRRRYFSSTMLRQMYNSVHRIRVNISRMQNQFSSPQSVAPASPLPHRPGHNTGIMNNLQQRVTDIQKAVNDIINRVTSTFQPTKKPGGQVMQVAL